MTVHRTHPPTRAMRDNPDIDQLKRQARELLEAYRAQSPDTIIEVAATIAPRRQRPSRCTTRSSCWRARTGSRAGRS
jgi:hypothetical protein